MIITKFVGVFGRDQENQLFIILDRNGPENRGKRFIFQHKVSKD